jgi:hypothetical protein
MMAIASGTRSRATDRATSVSLAVAPSGMTLASISTSNPAAR